MRCDYTDFLGTFGKYKPFKSDYAFMFSLERFEVLVGDVLDFPAKFVELRFNNGRWIGDDGVDYTELPLRQFGRVYGAGIPEMGDGAPTIRHLMPYEVFSAHGGPRKPVYFVLDEREEGAWMVCFRTQRAAQEFRSSIADRQPVVRNPLYNVGPASWGAAYTLGADWYE